MSDGNETPWLGGYQPADLADHGTRLVGRILDNLLWVGPILALMLARAPRELVFLGPALALGLQGYLVTTRGQTLGKWLAGTRVVSLDGSDVGFFRAYLLRDLFVFGVNLIPLGGLINALLIFGAERRCGHDRALGTIVVRDGAVIDDAPRPKRKKRKKKRPPVVDDHPDP